jgi:hypothetical protein
MYLPREGGKRACLPGYKNLPPKTEGQETQVFTQDITKLYLIYPTPKIRNLYQLTDTTLENCKIKYKQLMIS